jgi:hypothetical protein
MERNVIRVAGESCRAPRGSRAKRCSRTLFDTIYTVWTSAARVAMIDSGFTVERMAAMSPRGVTAHGGPGGPLQFDRLEAALGAGLSASLECLVIVGAPGS